MEPLRHFHERRLEKQKKILEAEAEIVDLLIKDQAAATTVEPTTVRPTLVAAK